ncbi:MAG: hypothetical protein ACYTFW_15375 [Planctomycetota bacterium]
MADSFQQLADSFQQFLRYFRPIQYPEDKTSRFARHRYHTLNTKNSGKTGLRKVPMLENTQDF